MYACRILSVSFIIRSRSRHNASAIVVWAPLLFSQWVGRRLSCSLVSRQSFLCAEGMKIRRKAFFKTCIIWDKATITEQQNWVIQRCFGCNITEVIYMTEDLTVQPFLWKQSFKFLNYECFWCKTPCIPYSSYI